MSFRLVYSEKASCEWIVGIVSRITSPNIERVTVVIVLDKPLEHFRVDFSSLADLFSGGNKWLDQQSAKLRFSIFGESEAQRKRAVEKIKGRCTELSKQGRVEIETGEMETMHAGFGRFGVGLLLPPRRFPISQD